ncbi:MAG: methyltransferase domain-containing protein [Kouleothrix sp.]|nr:methyltransferase domain-containing protein [Kouleothrix sp.]
MNDDPQYFARVTAGLEQVAWAEIERRAGGQLAGLGHRRVDFSYAGAPAALLDLRAVDDVYVHVAWLTGLDHTRASLGRLTGKLAEVDFAPALDIIASARELGPQPTYRVTASHLGRRNYSRYDVESAVAAALTGKLPWRFVLNAPDEDATDLDLRVLLEDDWALIGLRLGAAPLHRRAYKVASRTGSLKAPVAYCLCVLAGVGPADIVLDPACGAGTLLAEAASLATRGMLVGGDIDEGALGLAQANLGALGLGARVVAPSELGALAQLARGGDRPVALLYHGDATSVPLADRTVGAVVSNLPWGQQVEVAADLAELYAGMLQAIERALAPGGRAALLTDQAETLLAALAACPALRLDSSLQISLFGRHPTIYTIQKS